MKIFWSWQSDHLGKISRHFVRDALQRAVEEINSEFEIADAPRPEVVLDHDRKDVPGSPDLASVIFEKISGSAVFVADATPVGITADGNKKLLNSNVSIELGYALAKLTDRRVLMVMNEFYGEHSDLPFDLRHKAGPVLYRLDPEATKDQIDREMQKLVGKLKVQLKVIVGDFPAPVLPAFEPTPSIQGDPSRYVLPNQPLVTRNRGETERFKVPSGSLLFLRIQPMAAATQLTRSEAKELVRANGDLFEPFYYKPTGRSIEANEHGAIVFDADYEASLIVHAAQLFLNREIWAFDWSTQRPSPNGARGYRTALAELTFATMLPKYLRFAVEKLALPLPLRVIAGVSGVKGQMLYMPWSIDNELGPIQQDSVVWSGSIDGLDPGTIDASLLKLFEAVFDAAALRRPPALHGFPGAKPGMLPQPHVRSTFGPR